MEDIKHNKSSKTSALYVIMGITVILILVALLSSGITQFTGGQASTFVTVSFMAAFIGGFLSLISPCSAAMLPVFFAYSFKQKSELLKMTFIFYLGLATVFVPLGFASTLISKLFVEYPQLLFNIAGTIFIFLGIMLFFGKSFQVLPKKWRVAPQGKGAGTIYVMGILFAFATGTCAAPIIGGIYTIAATSGNAIQGVALLLVYALGLVGPMFLMAWFFDRFNFTNSKFVQSKSWDLRLAGKTFHLHTTNLIAATLFIGVGLLFILSRGTNSLFYIFDETGATDLYYETNIKLLEFTNTFPAWPFVIGIAIIVSIVFMKKKKNPKSQIEKTPKVCKPSENKNDEKPNVCEIKNDK